MQSGGLLAQAQRRVSGQMRQLLATGLPVSICYADERAGVLVVGIPAAEPGIGAEHRRLLRDSTRGVPVRFVQCGLARRHFKKKSHNRPLVGGLWVTSPVAGGMAQGSICVGALHTPSGSLGFLTAGHVAEAINTQFYQPNNNIPGQEAGLVTVITNYAVNADSDSAFLADSTGGQITRDRIWRTANDGYYTVTGTTIPVLNDDVHMMGAARVAERHGQIRAFSVSVTFEDGGVLDDQYLASYASHEGDSGAPVYVKIAGGTNVDLVGMNIGATLPVHVNPPINPMLHPPAANGTYAVISKWANIVNDLNVVR